VRGPADVDHAASEEPERGSGLRGDDAARLDRDAAVIGDEPCDGGGGRWREEEAGGRHGEK
jgi:hypothetical protein